jgi:hypothetical protein
MTDLKIPISAVLNAGLEALQAAVERLEGGKAFDPKRRPRRGIPPESLSGCWLELGSGTGNRTPVPWLRNAAGDLDGLPLCRFHWGFRTDVPAVSVGKDRFVRKVSSFFSSPGGPSLVTNADDLTGFHDAKGVDNLRHERTQFLHTVRAGHRYHDAMPLARKFC